MTAPQTDKSNKQGKNEAIFAVVLVLFIGLLLTCIGLITFGLSRVAKQKEIECRCADGVVVKQTVSAMFEPERVCPAICAERAKQTAPAQ